MNCLQFFLYISQKQWKIKPRLLLVTNRKCHTLFQITWKSLILNDLEGHCQPLRSAILATTEFFAYPNRATKDWKPGMGSWICSRSQFWSHTWLFLLMTRHSNAVWQKLLYLVYTIKQTSSNHQANVFIIKMHVHTCALIAWCLLDRVKRALP